MSKYFLKNQAEELLSAELKQIKGGVRNLERVLIWLIHMHKMDNNPLELNDYVAYNFKRSIVADKLGLI
ncbi:MAG: hypothetical protein GY834_15895 [Bacteroidetes bacterium]|nr:hypothetical protein [Bacteroidota bacterium]